MKDIVIPLLKPEDIEVKVKKVGKNGTQVLLYKTARTDMEYLDKVFGIGNWTCDYKEIKGNLYCTISVWDEDKKQWIPKVDCGTESREDGEGNEKKGEASDAFKRAGFKIGIGRELYSAPFTFINASYCPVEEKNGKFYLVDPFTKFAVSDIGYDENRKINRLVIINEKTGDVVYQNGGSTQPKAKRAEPKKQESAPKPVQKQEQKVEAKPEAVQEAKPDSALEAKVNAVVETSATIPTANEEPYKLVCKEFNKRHNLDRKKFVEIYNYAIKSGRLKPTKTLDKLEPDEWISLIASMQALFEEGFFKDVA